VSAIPVIDIAPLVNGAPEQAHAVAKTLGRACREVGLCFDAAQGGQPAGCGSLFGGILPRPQSRRRCRVPADLHKSGTAGEIQADHRRRLPSLAARTNLFPGNGLSGAGASSGVTLLNGWLVALGPAG